MTTPDRCPTCGHNDKGHGTLCTDDWHGPYAPARRVPRMPPKPLFGMDDLPLRLRAAGRGEREAKLTELKEAGDELDELRENLDKERTENARLREALRAANATIDSLGNGKEVFGREKVQKGWREAVEALRALAAVVEMPDRERSPAQHSAWIAWCGVDRKDVCEAEQLDVAAEYLDYLESLAPEQEEAERVRCATDSTRCQWVGAPVPVVGIDGLARCPKCLGILFDDKTEDGEPIPAPEPCRASETAAMRAEAAAIGREMNAKIAAMSPDAPEPPCTGGPGPNTRELAELTERVAKLEARLAPVRLPRQ